MYTKWSLTAFLFLGCAGAGILLYAAIKTFLDRGGSRRPFTALAASIISLVAVAAIALSFNNPTKILNLLGHPGSGLSSAVIMQCAIIIAGVMLYIKSADENRIPAGATAFISVLVAVIAVIMLSRIYTIRTRPALNTFLLPLIFVFIALQTAGYMLLIKDSFKQISRAMFIVACAYGLILLVFLIRIKGVDDRILSFAELSYGSCALIFWVGVVFCGSVIPALFSFISMRKQRVNAPLIQTIFFTAGVFAFCILVNQAPVIVKSINNRF